MFLVQDGAHLERGKDGELDEGGAGDVIIIIVIEP